MFTILQLNRFVFSASLLLAFAIASSRAVGARPSTYAFRPVSVTEEPVVLRVYNKQTHKTIWTRKASAGVDCYAWSRDHRALAVSWGVMEESGVRTSLRFTLWQAGEKPRTFTHLPKPMGQYPSPSSLYTECLVEMIWSPDKRQLLIRSGASMGETGNGMGDLWCVDTRTFKAKLLVNGKIYQATWVSPHKVSYKEYSGYRTNKAGMNVPIWLYKEVEI